VALKSPAIIVTVLLVQLSLASRILFFSLEKKILFSLYSFGAYILWRMSVSSSFSSSIVVMMRWSSPFLKVLGLHFSYFSPFLCADKRPSLPARFCCCALTGPCCDFPSQCGIFLLFSGIASDSASIAISSSLVSCFPFMFWHSIFMVSPDVLSVLEIFYGL